MKKIEAIYDSSPDTELGISAYLHCAKCLSERPAGISPADFSRTQIGIHREGWQVWCNRHACNVAVIAVRAK